MQLMVMKHLIKERKKTASKSLLPQCQLTGAVAVNPIAKVKAKGAQPERSRGQQCWSITVKELIQGTATA